MFSCQQVCFHISLLMHTIFDSKFMNSWKQLIKQTGTSWGKSLDFESLFSIKLIAVLYWSERLQFVVISYILFFYSRHPNHQAESASTLFWRSRWSDCFIGLRFVQTITDTMSNFKLTLRWWRQLLATVTSPSKKKETPHVHIVIRCLSMLSDLEFVLISQDLALY